MKREKEAQKRLRRPENRRQRRIQRRKREIMAAAARVFAEQGYANTTIREIAYEVDLAEGTLYNYFESKRDILLGIINDTDTLMETILLEGEDWKDREAFVQVVERGLDISEEQIPFLRTLFSEAWVDDDILQDFADRQLERIYRRLTAYIANRIEAGVFRDVNPALAAQLILGMFGSLLLPALRGVAPLPAPGERRALAEQMVDILLNGIQSPEN